MTDAPHRSFYCGGLQRHVFAPPSLPENARHSGSWEVSPRQPVNRIPDLSPGQLLAVSIYPEMVQGGARASTWALTVDSEGWTGADLLTHLPILHNSR